MMYSQPPIPATFIRRVSRFSAIVLVQGREEYVYVPNSGRMKELLVPGASVYVTEARPGSDQSGGIGVAPAKDSPYDRPARDRPARDRPARKTAFDLAMVQLGSTLVSIDSRVPGLVLAEAIRGGSLRAFGGYRTCRPEVRFGESRLDFLLTGGPAPFLVEVKSVTLVVGGQARFPDAPTPRGARHLRELARAVADGYRAAVIFVIQREDVDSFAPNDETDPEFGRALREAAAAGVEVYPFRCWVTPDRVEIAQELPVRL